MDLGKVSPLDLILQQKRSLSIGPLTNCQKTLAEMGGTPLPLNGKSAKLFQEIFFLKGLKMMFFLH